VQHRKIEVLGKIGLYAREIEKAMRVLLGWWRVKVDQERVY
jgi:hypothetical protein